MELNLNKDYYINSIHKNEKLTEVDLSNEKLIDLMVIDIVFAKVRPEENYYELVKEEKILNLMTFDLKGDRVTSQVKMLIELGVRPEYILVFGKSNEGIYNEYQVLKQDLGLPVAKNMLKNSLKSKVCVYFPYEPFRQYIEKKSINDPRFRQRVLLPTSPFEKELGISNEMRDAYRQVTLKRSKFSKKPEKEENLYAYIELKRRLNSKNVNEIVVYETSKDGSPTTKASGCSLMRLFWKRVEYFCTPEKRSLFYNKSSEITKALNE